MELQRCIYIENHIILSKRKIGQENNFQADFRKKIYKSIIPQFLFRNLH